MKRYKIKRPVQPLVYKLGGTRALCGAIAELSRIRPKLSGSLSIYRGRYYLAVRSPLLARGRVRAAVGRYGQGLGAARVLYAYCAEHGRELSCDAIAELGGPIGRD